ncbi:class I SAM-dependent methyltransferase [Candidatus Parcubacteria bacterium]|nr:MAG: class I SAM-dependent methyltransferase [Candidatus Parcubacteria bacterium]
MKKDYIPVTKDTSCPEKDFIDQYWTQIWDKVVDDNPDLGYEENEMFKIISPFIYSLKGNAQILDGGCGLGKWTAHFFRKGYNVTGIDISQKTIGRLNELFPNLNFKVADIRKTKFEDESFDAYYSWGVFEHFEVGLGPCFQEARRILKKGGYLFVSVPYQNYRHLRRGNKDLSNWDKHFDAKVGYKTSMRFYQYRLTKIELKREFEINGFKCLKVEPIAKKNGIIRMLNDVFNIKPSSKLCKITTRLLIPLVPKDYISHMILGIGYKKNENIDSD